MKAIKRILPHILFMSIMYIIISFIMWDIAFITDLGELGGLGRTAILLWLILIPIVFAEIYYDICKKD